MTANTAVGNVQQELLSQVGLSKNKIKVYDNKVEKDCPYPERYPFSQGS
jgi:hypothetical protein